MKLEKVKLKEPAVATITKLRSEPVVDIPEAKKKEIIEELRAATAPDRVKDEPHLLAYHRGPQFMVVNKGPKSKQGHMVVYPKSNEEIKDILRIATKHQVPVTPICLQSAMPGSVPWTGGILMDLMSMNKVLKIDTNHGYIVVEPGTSVNQIMQEILPKRYTLAKGTYYSSFSVLGTLVPWVAMHNFINRMLDQVIGLEVITPDGSTIHTGSMLHRESGHWTDMQISTPRLNNLFQPSQGTIGIITKAAIRIWPLLEETAIPMFGFDTFESSLRWSHAMAKSNMVDTTMCWNWNIVGGTNYKLSEKYLDYLEARINNVQEDAPKHLNLWGYYGWAQMRGYKEEVQGAISVAKRLAEQHGGVYIPDDELKETLPDFWKYMAMNFKDFTMCNLEANTILQETQGFTDQFCGTVDELVKLYEGLKDKMKEYNYKNWGGYTRMVNQGQTVFYRYFPHADCVAKEEVASSSVMAADVAQFCLDNYDVSVVGQPFRYNDPEKPEEVIERAKPVRRLLRAVQTEFDPEGILSPMMKKYTLL